MSTYVIGSSASSEPLKGLKDPSARASVNTLGAATAGSLADAIGDTWPSAPPNVSARGSIVLPPGVPQLLQGHLKL